MKVELGIVVGCIGMAVLIEELSVFLNPNGKRYGPYPIKAVVISGVIMSCVPISCLAIVKQLF